MASAAASACQCSAEGRMKRVLIVKKLHPAVTMQSLLTTFGAYGAITGCKVFTHKSGRSAGCASVEFASHQSACTAYGQLQGAPLHGKSICLQWFDQNLTAASPMRSIGGTLDVGSPMKDNSRSSRRHSLQLLSAGSGAGALAGQSPFSMLAGSPHHSYMHSAAAAAAQQQQMAALMAGAGQRSQQQMLRQASAPLSCGLQSSLAGVRIPASPYHSTGSFDGLASPSPMHTYDSSSRGGLQDSASIAAAAAAAAVNLSAAMAAASIPMQGSNDFAILQQLAALQQQQQLAALALQQVGNTFGPQLDFQQASPLSPARSLQHQQQQQQQVIALAALQSQQQQVQAQLLQQQQQQQQVASPAPAISRLQLARSMPAALSGSFGSLCSSSDSHMQAHSCNMFMQQHRQHETPGSAASTQQTSPFALSQPGVGAAVDASTDTSSSAGGLAVGAAASEGGTDTTRQLDTPSSAAAFGSSHASKFAQHAKKQLFSEGTVDGSPLLQADGSWSAGFGSPAKSVRGWAGRSSTDDTASPGPDIDMLAAALSAGAGGGIGVGWGSRKDQQVLSPGTPGLLTSLQSYPSAPLPSTSPVLHSTREQLARAAAAALEQQQQQTLLAAAYGTHQPQQLPPTSRSLQARGLGHSEVGEAAGSDVLANRLSNLRVKDDRAGDSQLLGAYSQWDGNTTRQVLSPSIAAAGRSPSNGTDAAAYAAVQAWQQGVAALTGQSPQPRNSSPAPSSEGCRFKQKQHLQLQMPELNAATSSAPMTCTAVPGGWEQTLIGTDVLPESPAASMPCRADWQSALLAATAAAGSSTLTTAGGQTWGNMDWSSESSLSALLSPVHVTNLASRRWTALTGDAAFCSNSPQSSSNNLSNDPSAANSGTLPIRWGAAAMGRSSSCGLRTVSEDQALSGTAAEWGLSSTPGHSSLCLDVPGQIPPLQVGSGDQSGLPTGSVYREVSLASNNNEPVIAQGSSRAGDTSSRSVSSPAQAAADSVLFSSDSFTFSPHLRQQHQQGNAISTVPPPAEDDAVITEPFQMPAFFRPSRSSQDMTGTGSPVKGPGKSIGAAGAGTAAAGGGGGTLNGASSSSDDSPTKARGSASTQQLQTALSHSSEGSSAFEGSPGHQLQPSGVFKGQSHAVQADQLCVSSEDVPAQSFRRMWGSAAGDTQ